mmetsp:Transcript_69322/g.203480  ORF Transcript_69322/g.203480 Transcript_69322/m.203480 type:complete len:498 (+) Transcript_69322:2006-3499(+)
MPAALEVTERDLAEAHVERDHDQSADVAGVVEVQRLDAPVRRPAEDTRDAPVAEEDGDDDQRHRRVHHVLAAEGRARDALQAQHRQAEVQQEQAHGVDDGLDVLGQAGVEGPKHHQELGEADRQADGAGQQQLRGEGLGDAVAGELVRGERADDADRDGDRRDQPLALALAGLAAAVVGPVPVVAHGAGHALVVRRALAREAHAAEGDAAVEALARLHGGAEVLARAEAALGRRAGPDEQAREGLGVAQRQRRVTDEPRVVALLHERSGTPAWAGGTRGTRLADLCASVEERVPGTHARACVVGAAEVRDEGGRAHDVAALPRRVLVRPHGALQTLALAGLRHVPADLAGLALRGAGHVGESPRRAHLAVLRAAATLRAELRPFGARHRQHLAFEAEGARGTGLRHAHALGAEGARRAPHAPGRALLGLRAGRRTTLLAGRRARLLGELARRARTAGEQGEIAVLAGGTRCAQDVALGVHAVVEEARVAGVELQRLL